MKATFKNVCNLEEFKIAEQVLHDFLALVEQDTIWWPLFYDQAYRSALSVVSNIAEGIGRGSYKQLRQFFHIARGSALEHAAQLRVHGYDTVKIERAITLLNRRLEWFEEAIELGHSINVPFKK